MQIATGSAAGRGRQHRFELRLVRRREFKFVVRPLVRQLVGQWRCHHKQSIRRNPR